MGDKRRSTALSPAKMWALDSAVGCSVMRLEHGHTSQIELSTQMNRAIGVALAGIKRATPNVGPEEIHRRAVGYTRLPWNREHTRPSAQALAKWWADCDRPEESSRPAPSPGLDDSWLQRAGGWGDDG